MGPSSESDPLLIRHDDDLRSYGTQPTGPDSHASRAPSPDKRRVRWPSIISLTVLIVSILAILIFAFAVPAIVKEYVEQAALFTPTDLAVDSVGNETVRARVQGSFVLDSCRVHKKNVRDIGRFATWIAREVQSEDSNIQVFLPEYGGVLLGTASIPSIKVNIRNGHVNYIDLFANLFPGNLGSVRPVADDWIEGRLGSLTIHGSAKVYLKSGLLSFGTQVISRTVVIEEHQFPTNPKLNITKLNFYDTNSTTSAGAMVVDASLKVLMDLPLSLTIPSLGFDVLVPNCSPDESYILVANARTSEIDVKPSAATGVNVTGLVERLPDELTTACPDKRVSPLDLLLTSYIHGLETTIYVQGADAPSTGAPDWLVNFLKGLTIPVPFTGHSLGNLVKSFSMSDVHFSLPDFFAEPGTPDAHPKISALVRVLIGLPEQMNFQVDVPFVRADADVYYLGNKLGKLTIHEWSRANSTRVQDSDGLPALFVEFPMKDAPLEVTDEETLSDVVQILLFGEGSVELHVLAAVDTKVVTGLGQFAVHDIPAEGNVRVKAPSGGDLMGKLKPRVETLEIGSTNESSIVFKIRMNATNPTMYSAAVPYVDFLLTYNGTAVAHVTAKNLSLVPGLNSGISVELSWSPLKYSGKRGLEAGRRMLSQYISGENVTVAVQSHPGTIPGLPRLGRSLSKISIQFQIPPLPVPRSPDGDGDDDDDDDDGERNGGAHFIQDATLHLFSSTAEFTLFSPLPNTSMFITCINATAFYDKTERVGKIVSNLPFEVPPGISRTPRLPVDLELSGVGYEAVKKALGGSLKMDAVATVGVQIQQYTDVVVYRGEGIGAKVRI